MREVCEANGLTEKVFVRESHLLSSLDLFMSGLNNSGCLNHFGGLTAICFINVPNLNSVSGLDGFCPGQSYHVVASETLLPKSYVAARLQALKIVAAVAI